MFKQLEEFAQRELADWRAGRIFGKKQRFLAAKTMQFIELAIRKTRERLNRAERREDICRSHTRKVKQKRDADYTRSAEAAVDEAKELVLAYISGGEPNWHDACRDMQIHERTAQNLLALLALHEDHPEVFKLFAKLGRSKLYMLARLPKRVLKVLRPDEEVYIGEHPVTLANMSAKELKWYLKSFCPRGDGKRVPALKAAVEKCADIARRPVAKLGMERGEIKEAADKLEIVLEQVRIRLREAS
jgi:hypothetical protein